jgi:hypothetical protein
MRGTSAVGDLLRGRGRAVPELPGTERNETLKLVAAPYYRSGQVKLVSEDFDVEDRHL